MFIYHHHSLTAQRVETVSVVLGKACNTGDFLCAVYDTQVLSLLLFLLPLSFLLSPSPSPTVTRLVTPYCGILGKGQLDISPRTINRLDRSVASGSL